MLTGAAPRSAQTASVHRLFRDAHATEPEFDAAIKKDEKELIAAQKNFAFKSGGQLGWLDVLRPLTRCLHGFSLRRSAGEDAVGPVTRWFRTNTFYRKPLVHGKIELKDGGPADFLPKLSEGVAFLPTPYTFVRLVENGFYESEEELAADYAKAIAKGSKSLKGKGYNCLLLFEPFVGHDLSKGQNHLPEWFSATLSKVKTREIKLGINFPLASAEDAVLHAEGSGVDFIGIDATYSPSLSIKTEKDVLLGVVDGGRPLIEGREIIGRRVKEFLADAKFSGNYYIGPNDRLYDVPFETALKKISALSAFGVS